ncbi:DUF1877 family protein [Hymenobacter sp. BRD128]|uniref:DUF1877 family protein n=1 Tax=Hymenobacter sp. BRD128 TaxID=2675878 RepID=UPI001567594D|nr:DUF1877 family protein [Hymenobacter sp. BRD128]QKG56811.1 DUF1877 family protein [Hymenobacter sp. BRD128]
MALDLTLCLVPKQIEALFSKALLSKPYAEWMEFIPGLLRGKDFADIQDNGLAELTKDVEALSHFFHFTEDYYFYDVNRSFSTVDYLFNEYIKANSLPIQPDILWEGGNAFSTIVATQGMPIRLYDETQVRAIALLLINLEFADLLKYYEYDKMLEAGVYKLNSLERRESLKDTFYTVKYLFLAAFSEGLLVFKAID